MVQSQTYISNLTPLRGIAALWVFFFHFQGLIATFIHSNTTHLVELGYLMVDLFFIMSGFIILHVYGDKFSKVIARKNFWDFTKARFARIYPLHLFTLIVLIIFVASTNAWNPIYDPKAIPANLALIHSFGLFPVFTWNVPSWSISAEWWAYMIFPLTAVFLSRYKKFAIPSLLVLIVFAYYSIMFLVPRKNPFDPNAVIPHNLDVTFDFGYLRGLAGFVTGMVIYSFYQLRWVTKIFQKDLTALLVVGGALFALHVKINDGFYILFFTLIVLCFACNNGILKRICDLRFAQFIGDISYSIYLIQALILMPFLGGIQLPFIKYGKSPLDYNEASFWYGIMYFIIFLMVLLGLSTLSYKYIEVPCRKWINTKWKKQKPALAT